MDTSPPSEGVGTIPNPRFGEDGKVITPRVKTPQKAREIHEQMFQADTARRLERSYIQAALANKQPFNPDLMKAAGLEGCSNIDMRYMSTAIRKELAPAASTFVNTKKFMSIKTKAGLPEQRSHWEEVMSMGHTRMLNSWAGFMYRYLYCWLYQLSHGKAFSYFPNAHTPFWEVASEGEILIPEFSKTDTTDFGTASCPREWQVSELYKEIKGFSKEDWEASKASTEERYNGWHLCSVLRAMGKATEKDFYQSNDFDLIQREWEANEIFFTCSEKVVKCIIQWSTEGDGKVTQYILTKIADHDDDGNEAFLYKEIGKYKSMASAIVMFTDNIGTNGYAHTVKGRGSAMFPSARKLNELMNRMYDAVDIELSVPITGTEEAINSELAYTRAGPFWIINPGIKMLERKNPDYSNSAIPAIQMLKSEFMNVLGDSAPKQKGDPMTDIMDQLDGVDDLGAMLWVHSWNRLLRESLRRAIAIKSSAEPGGHEVFEFRKYCMENGVPEDAIDKIDVEGSFAIMPIGNGSPKAMMLAMNQMDSLVPFMDEKGKNNYARAKAAALPGVTWQHVDEFLPEVPGLRPGLESAIAGLENNQLMQGMTVDVLPDEPPIVHLTVHLTPMQQILEAVEQGQMTRADASTKLFELYKHCELHLQMATDTKLVRNQLNEFRRAIEVMGEIIVNGQRELRAQQEKAQQEGAANGQGGPSDASQGAGGMLDQKQLSEVVKGQLRIADAHRNWEMADEEHRIKMSELQKDAAQKRALNSAKAAADLAVKTLG